MISLLQLYASAGRCTVRSVFDLARQMKYTGAVTFHFRGGLPIKVEAGRPTQLDIDTEGLDKPAVVGADSTLNSGLTG